MGFPIGDLFGFSSILLAGAQTCKLFENNLMATRYWSKERFSDFIARIDLLSTLISNAIQLKGRQFKKLRFSTKKCTKMVNISFSFKPGFTCWLLDLNILPK